MLRKVNNIPAHTPGYNYLLCVAYKTITPETPSEQGRKARFGLFIRLKPGTLSYFPNQKRVWYYPGDKFTDEEYKMLRNLLNHLKKKVYDYDRVELYDNNKGIEERIIFKMTDGIIEANAINQYSLMLLNYPLPEWLK